MSARAELSVALGVVALGVFVLSGISTISAGAGYDRIGPRFFPYGVASGLILLGGSLLVSLVRRRRASRETAARVAVAPRLDWMPLGYLGLAFLLFLALLERAGFIVASSVQFWLVARAFHSKRPVRDGAVAALVSAVIYVAFSRSLGLTLPSGVLESLF